MVAPRPSKAEPVMLPPESSTPHADALERMTIVSTRPHLLFVLGDTKSETTENVTPRVWAESELVLNGGSFSPPWEQTLRPLGAWSYAVRHRVRDLYLIDDVAAAMGLRDISVLSVGKAGQCDATAVREEIEQVSPELTVCAGCETTYWPLVGRLELGHALLTTAYGEPIYYSLLNTGERQSVLLHFWHPSQGYYTNGGHHHLFKLFLHAYDALWRKRLLSGS